MRVADRWLGVPACAVLTLVRKLGEFLLKRPDENPRRILFVKLAEQGATVLACSAIRRTVEKVGSENVFFLVFKENRFILDVMELVRPENVITIRTTGLFRLMADALCAVRRIRKMGINAAVDMEFFARSSAALTYLSGARRRVGFHAYAGEASYRGDLMTHRLSFNSYLHASQMFQMQVEALDGPADRLPAFNLLPPSMDEGLPEFNPQAGEIEEVERTLRGVFGREKVGPLVLLNANCSDLLPLRRWPSQRYVELSHRLLQKYSDVHIAFTGAPQEAQGARRLVEEIGSDRCACMAGHTSLRQLLVLYCLAEVLITNDSGPAHFATLTPVDVVTLFGPETPAVFGARSKRSHILWSGIVCSPCVNAYNDRLSACTDNICMKRISLEQVFEVVCDIYDRRRQSTDLK